MELIMYAMVAFSVFIIGLVNDLICDFEYLSIQIIIGDVAESLIIAISWFVSLPILSISNILISIVNILKGDDE